VSRALTVTMTVTVALLAGAASARAGVYEVHACGGPAGAVQRAFAPSADPFMEAYSICPPQNGVGTGIATKASSRGGTAAYGAGAYQVFAAPAGAALESVSFNVGAIRLGSFWSLGIVAFDGDFNAGDLPYGCYYGRPGCDVGTSTFSIRVAAPLLGHGRFRFETRCFNPGGCDVSASSFNPANRALFSAANVTVRVQDHTRPWIGPHHGAIWSDGWHRGREEAWAHFADNVGIMSTRIYADGALAQMLDFRDPSLPEWAGCDFTLPKPCKDFEPGGLTVDTGTLPDGEHTVRLEAIDAAGNLAAIDRQIKVDNSAPAKASGLTLEGPEGWRSENDFAVRWANPPGQAAPISKANYQLCPVGSAPCTTGAVAAAAIEGLTGLTVPGPGEYDLRVSLEDAAGNHDPQRASDPVRLRFDDEPPSVVFEAPDRAHPTRVTAALADRGSGVAEAAIEIRGAGRRHWQELDASLHGGVLVGDVDDVSLPDGAYDVRARARDRAGNERTGDRRRDGAKMQLELPLRLRSGIVLSSRGRPRCHRRRGRKRKCRAPAAAGAGIVVRSARAHIDGLLRSADGEPIAQARISVFEQLRTGGGWRTLAELRSDRDGRFSVAIPRAPSRSIRFAYGGTPLVKPASGEVRMLVPAASTMSADRRSVRNGDAVAFTGRLAGGYVPDGGKLIDLQAYYRGRWRTFATARTDARGRWSYRYRFGATRGTVRYRFRARIRREAAYPYELGYSRRVIVTVRG
jgi:hypothetical protein